MYESLIYENRWLVPVLATTGMEVRYVEVRDGHNWENWRERLRDGASWLFPGTRCHWRRAGCETPARIRTWPT